MIRVIVGNNLKRESKTVSEDTTLRAVLDAAGVDYNKGLITMDGVTLKAGDLNKTFREFGFDGTPGKDSAYLVSVAKADNAR